MHASADDNHDTSDHEPQALLLTAEQAAMALAICRTKVYELLRNGELESVQIGVSRRIPATALAEYVQSLRDQARVPVGAWDRRPTVVRRAQGC
jgi:excisionase family DNA binding protein